MTCPACTAARVWACLSSTRLRPRLTHGSDVYHGAMVEPCLVENPRTALAGILSGRAAAWPSAPAISAEAWLDAAAGEGVVALVDWRLRGGLAGTPRAVHEAFADAARGEVARLMVRQAEARKVLARLAEAGLPVLLLKGSALAYWAYPEPHLRHCSDVDLLLASREQALAAAEALADEGYRVTQSFGTAATREFICRRDLAGGRAVELDIHWALSSAPVFADRLAFDEMQAQAMPLPALAAHARGLGPVHAMVNACMHRASDLSNGGGEKLKWLYDLHLLANGMDDAQWLALAALARARGLAGLCADALLEAANLFDSPLPAAAMAALAEASVQEPLDAGRLREWGYFQRQNLRALPDWRSRLRWIWQRLMPTADYRAEAGVEGVGLVRHRFGRALRHLRR